MVRDEPMIVCLRCVCQYRLWDFVVQLPSGSCMFCSGTAIMMFQLPNGREIDILGSPTVAFEVPNVLEGHVAGIDMDEDPTGHVHQ